MTGARREQLEQAANLFLDARRTGKLIENLPEALRPTSLEEAYVVQDEMMKAYEPIGGWKIGGPPTDIPFFAPMPTSWMAASGSTFKGHNLRGLEAEIAFQIGHDLPPRTTPYSREEVIAAIGSCHPAIEILELGLADMKAVDKFVSFGDMQMHGGFVYGPAFTDWKSQDWAQESVTLAVDGTIRVERTASNPAGTDLIRLLIFLANEGAPRTGGLKKGDWITTGSWTGNTFANADSSVDVNFKHAGRVTMRFA
ncbi:MAG: 2-keto-4-pentenoate hydratase [Acidobacteriaceae bacterium]|jgi:2-keto-4-pentenoate hydratase|nr:2-keto-4-pentenoate hydratase [Acidobacteriaceae bacterium]